MITEEGLPGLKSNGLTHEVADDFAHGRPEDEVLEQGGDEGEGHAENGHHEVADSQGEQEGVGDGTHALVHHQHHDDEQVAKHADQEDEAVEQDSHGLHL